MEPACDRERRAVLLAAGLALGGAAVPAAAAGGIEGLWLASVGSEDNRARVGLEIGRAADGALQAFFTIDQLNFFRVSLPPLEPAGEGRWTIRKFEIEIALAGDRLRCRAWSTIRSRCSASPPCRSAGRRWRRCLRRSWRGGSVSAVRSTRLRRFTRIGPTSATPTA